MTKWKHDWVTSQLGHGNVMCTRCFMTDLEARALGRYEFCDTPPPAPKAENDNRTELK